MVWDRVRVPLDDHAGHVRRMRCIGAHPGHVVLGARSAIRTRRRAVREGSRGDGGCRGAGALIPPSSITCSRIRRIAGDHDPRLREELTFCHVVRPGRGCYNAFTRAPYTDVTPQMLRGFQACCWPRCSPARPCALRAPWIRHTSTGVPVDRHPARDGVPVACCHYRFPDARARTANARSSRASPPRIPSRLPELWRIGPRRSSS